MGKGTFKNFSDAEEAEIRKKVSQTLKENNAAIKAAKNEELFNRQFQNTFGNIFDRMISNIDDLLGKL